MIDKTGKSTIMEKPFSDDSSFRKHDDTNINSDKIKEENFDPLYYIKTELDDEENFLSQFISDDKDNLDVKPDLYSCTACNIQFTELQELEEHVETHQIDKEHVCANCDKKFLHEIHFQIHLDDHLSKQEQDTLKQEYCYCPLRFIDQGPQTFHFTFIC